MDEQQIYTLTESVIRQYLYSTPISGLDYQRHAKEMAEGIARVLVNNLEPLGERTSVDTGLEH